MLDELQAEGDLLEGLLAGGARPDVLAGAFPAQLAFIRDAAPFKASFCTRRAAKSYSVGLEFIDDSFDHPRAHYLFLMTVRAQAERDFWNDVLKAIDRQYNLGIKFNETKLIATTPNGAKIYVGGADSTDDEWRKLIGGKYRKVHVDEAQAFVHQDLAQLVYEAFKPAVADYRGTIGLSGTPGMLNKGLFFDVTHGHESGWSVHRWKTSDNTSIGPKGKRICDEVAAEIAELRLLKPGVELTPSFRRNYLAEWVIEDTDLVYRYAAERNSFVVLPSYPRGEWHHVLATDLGYNDPTSFTVCAYHDFDPCLYLVESSKESGMDLTAVAIRAKALDRKYDFDAMVIDGANKQAVEEMRKRHDVPWRAADKTGKSDFIELMNGEFIIGRIKLGPDCGPLAAEYADLIWNDKATKREEHPACENHCTDGALYGWRWCYQYLNQLQVPPPAPGSPEAIQEQEDETERVAEAMARRQAGADDEDLQAWSQ